MSEECLNDASLNCSTVSENETKNVKTTVNKARELTDDELTKLKKDTLLVSDFKQMKLEKEAQKNWDLFYKRNTTRFFKDRHWTKREFEELCETTNGHLTIFEAGCGVGNFIFPLLEDDTEKKLKVYACDFSPRAVNFVKENPLYDKDRCLAFQCDLTNDDLTENIPSNSVNIATLIFVLSAIHPDKMITALRNVLKVLKPGGCLLFRDYGLYDHAMLRFTPGHKLSEQFYVRQDGTRAYYFSIEDAENLFIQAGYDVSIIDYIHRETKNLKEGLCVPRIFVQAKCRKPDHISNQSEVHIDQTSFVKDNDLVSKSVTDQSTEVNDT